MKNLLNELIRKGRKPRGKQGKMEFSFMLGGGDSGVYELNFLWGEYPIKISIKKSIRELCSLESGLWQFVCENEMIKIEYGKIREKYDETVPTTDKNKVITYRQLLGEDNYEYRLIESSLKDESELEDFLLSNIKIEGKI